jgi:hypothetical protein
MNQAPQQGAQQPWRPGFALLFTIFILSFLTSGLYLHGRDFYPLGLAERALHPAYRMLNPAGLVGHGYGIVGTGLILTNLLYLVRRRLTRALAWAGSVGAWLDLHAFTGLVGSVLILYHSAFQLRTPIATVTSGSLAIVVVTGLVGFYLHALVPREGLRPLNERLTEIEPLLPGLVKQVREFVKTTPLTTLPADASFLRTIFTIPRWAFQAAKRRRGLRKAARKDKMFRVLERKDKRLAKEFYTELGLLAASEVDTVVGAALMRSWRSLHGFLAILMIVSVTVHIGVAWYYGFRWIFE